MATSITPLDASNVNEGTGGSIPLGKEVVLFSRAVTGGTLYTTVVRGSGNGDPAGVASSFVAASALPASRQLKLTDAKSDAGVALTATATSGAMGVARTAGTSLVLVGEATSASAKTDKAAWEFVLPDTYVAGAAIVAQVDANYTGSGTVTAASTTVALAAYTETAAGVEAAIAGVTAAQQISGTAAVYSFTVPGSGLVAGQRLVFEVTLLVTTSAGALTGQVNSVSYAA